MTGIPEEILSVEGNLNTDFDKVALEQYLEVLDEHPTRSRMIKVVLKYVVDMNKEHLKDKPPPLNTVYVRKDVTQTYVRKSTG